MSKKIDVRMAIATYLAPEVLKREGRHPERIAKISFAIADALVKESKKVRSDYKIDMKEKGLDEYLEEGTCCG